jgi:hypothetical protein
MIDKTGRVEMREGTRQRWVKPADVAQFERSGWQRADQEVRAVLKPTKKQQVEVEPQQPTNTEE